MVLKDSTPAFAYHATTTTNSSKIFTSGTDSQTRIEHTSRTLPQRVTELSRIRLGFGFETQPKCLGLSIIDKDCSNKTSPVKNQGVHPRTKFLCSFVYSVRCNTLHLSGRKTNDEDKNLSQLPNLHDNKYTDILTGTCAHQIPFANNNSLSV